MLGSGREPVPQLARGVAGGVTACAGTTAAAALASRAATVNLNAAGTTRIKRDSPLHG
jgi:hypothetical protein